MAEQAQLDELLSFISGTGKYAIFGSGMHTYPTSEDADQRRKYEMCLELEQQGKIRKHIVTDTATVWMPTEPEDRK